jgi:hypothetical protein
MKNLKSGRRESVQTHLKGHDFSLRRWDALISQILCVPFVAVWFGVRAIFHIDNESLVELQQQHTSHDFQSPHPPASFLFL